MWGTPSLPSSRLAIVALSLATLTLLALVLGPSIPDLVIASNALVESSGMSWGGSQVVMGLRRRPRHSKRAPTPHRPPRIRINSPLPDALVLGTSSFVYKLWKSSLYSLSLSASRLTTSTLSKPGLEEPITGIPGTGIVTDTEARELQDHLDCMSGDGEWVRDEVQGERERSGSAGLTVHKQEGIYASCDKRYYKGGGEGGWDARESLKWRWIPSTTCDRTAPTSHANRTTSSLTRRGLCAMIAHKSILLVGDTPQFSLHDLILDWTSLTPHTCYGDLYCKEHLLCADVLAGTETVEDWSDDERVYHRLPSPSTRETSGSKLVVMELGNDDSLEEGRLHKRVQRVIRPPSEGTSLRYRRSDGLRPYSPQSHPTFRHPSTGVREINQQWVADSRRSDLVIISKPPLPLPSIGVNTTWDSWWDTSAVDPASRLVEAARRMTEEVWLPEVLETLRAIRAFPSPADQLVVYRGGWRAHPDCASTSLAPEEDVWESGRNSPGDGPPPRLSPPTLSQILYKTTTSGLEELNDVHAVFFNLQTILQNHIARRQILPSFGVPFLDMETPLSVWRSGMVGSSMAPTFGTKGHGNVGMGLRSSGSGDCSRYCIPSPGMASTSLHPIISRLD
jgi:hypothetical protein